MPLHGIVHATLKEFFILLQSIMNVSWLKKKPIKIYETYISEISKWKVNAAGDSRKKMLSPTEEKQISRSFNERVPIKCSLHLSLIVLQQIILFIYFKTIYMRKLLTVHCFEGSSTIRNRILNETWKSGSIRQNRLKYGLNKYHLSV